MRYGWAWALALASMLVACGDGGDAVGSGSGGTPGDPPSGDPPGGGGGGGGGGDPALPCSGLVMIRLRGSDPGALTGLRLGTGVLAASADGALVVSRPGSGSYELVGTDAHPLGQVAPAGAGSVDVRLPLVSASAAWGGAGEDVTVCTPPLEFTFRPAAVDPERCHVVVELDLSRSVLRGATATLLPQFKVVY